MNRIEHLLTILGEECAEVAVRCSKAKRFGLQEVQPQQPFTNAERIMIEVNDLYGILKMLNDEGILVAEPDPFAIARKIEKVEKFLLYSQQCGTLDADAVGKGCD